MISRIPPRFTIERKTGRIICHKPIEGEELIKLQTAILKKQVQLHPELLADWLSEENDELGKRTDLDQWDSFEKEP